MEKLLTHLAKNTYACDTKFFHSAEISKAWTWQGIDFLLFRRISMPLLFFILMPICLYIEFQLSSNLYLLYSNFQAYTKS